MVTSEMTEKGTQKQWDLPDEREPLMHRIHAYPAKFPAFITSRAVELAREKGKDVRRIGDIFCGCGTTALESRRLGLDFWGCDINPVATLIARVKSEKYQSGRLKSYLVKIMEASNVAEVDVEQLNTLPERLAYWFEEDTRRDLLILRSAIISSVGQGKYQDFFLCAFSNILKATSRWLTKSIKPQVDPDKHPVDVYCVFLSQSKKMIKAVEECASHLGVANPQIVTSNFLEVDEQDVPGIDLIVSSPPYVTSYEYADLHQLSTLWLEFVDDYRDLREGTIGSVYNTTEIKEEMFSLRGAAQEMVFRLYGMDKAKGRAAARYFTDLNKTVEKTYRLLTPKGMAVFVIGNTEYKGVRIDNRQFLVESMECAGFRDVQVQKRRVTSKILTPYRDKKGRFSQDSKSRKVYAEEYIVHGEKNAES